MPIIYMRLYASPCGEHNYDTIQSMWKMPVLRLRPLKFESVYLKYQKLHNTLRIKYLLGPVKVYSLAISAQYPSLWMEIMYKKQWLTWSTHQMYSSSVSPFHAYTGTPVLAMAAAAKSCVEKMLQLDHWTFRINTQ